MDKTIKNIINECNSKRARIFYNLSQLEQITGLSPRMLKYRMTKVRVKYADMPYLLTRESKSWKIHFSIISEFLPKRGSKKGILSSHRWSTLATWNMRNNYDAEYHLELINQVQQKLPLTKFYYAIELDGRGFPHAHLISDAELLVLREAIKGVLNLFLNKDEYRLEVTDLNNKHAAVSYLLKGSVFNGVIS